MSGAAAAFVLVAIELLGGTFLFLWLTMIGWSSVDRGHFRATTWALLPILAGMAFLIPSPARGPVVVLAALSGAYLAALYMQRPLLEWILGAGAAASAVWSVISASGVLCPTKGIGGDGSTICEASPLLALTGFVFLGAVTHGMVLGHWYLNQPRLPIEPLKGATLMMFAAIGASLVVGIAFMDALSSGVVAGTILPVASSTYWFVWLFLLAATGVLAVMVRQTVWARSTQSATGLMYLQTLVALSAQFVMQILVMS